MRLNKKILLTIISGALAQGCVSSSDNESSSTNNTESSSSNSVSSSVSSVMQSSSSSSNSSNLSSSENTQSSEDTQSSQSSAGSSSSAPIAIDSLYTGKGSLAVSPNPASYACVYDFGNWVWNAGIVEVAVEGCDVGGDYNGVPIGEPTPLIPQLTAQADLNPTPSHRWWGSLAFLGEMQTGAANQSGYITPDPIQARISEKGVRLSGIPNGLQVFNENDFGAQIPAPADEVHEGLAIANSLHADLDAKMHAYSDGSVTAHWFAGDTLVMEGTFVYGSPYVFFKVHSGDAILRSFGNEGAQKAIFLNENNMLGVTTNVSSINTHMLIVGDGATSFNNTASQDTTLQNSSGEFTFVLLPPSEQAPATDVINRFSAYARNKISALNIDYRVDSATQAVIVEHSYLGENNQPVETLAGLMPLHWKNTQASLTDDKVRSARGMVRFAQTSQFNYTLPFVGVLPSLPSDLGEYDKDQLKTFVNDFINQGEANWNTRDDTYWAGKNYGKVAELAAIARAEGMTTEADRLITWLKSELEDWFTSTPTEVSKYFYYDENWNTLLGFGESFGSHQQLNDHHFHYGYFVRAAAEICRVDKSWCNHDNYGAMVELLIRDYAGSREDSQFPYLRNFDPANGFSWASGHANFTRGNNNESTSEAANAYGAMVLYGMITGNDAIKERGIYLHASSTNTFWEYWNNIDRYNGLTGDHDNFPAGYDKITTSIIWGNGAVYSTWFSGADAHILGIQGLPLSPLVFHLGIYADYLADYVTQGMAESPNQLPSGLPEDQWRDVWWNIMAMTDGDAAIADMLAKNWDYTPEAGETMAHTYHWVYSFAGLGHLQTGTGAITANHPAAVVFEKAGQKTYLAYNYGEQAITVTYSDGTTLVVPGNDFGIK